MKERVKGERGAPRSEIVAVRFDEKLKNRMELAAAKQLRSVANYIEWAVIRSLEVEGLSFGVDSDECDGSKIQKTSELDEFSAARAYFDKRSGKVVVELKNGCELAFPPALIQGLDTSSEDELNGVVITPSGLGLHFPNIDIDLSVPALFRQQTGSRAWMAEQKSRVEAALPPEPPVEAQIQQVVMLHDGRMTRKNAALYLGVSPKTLAQWAISGTGPKYIKRGLVWYTKDNLDRWIKGY